MEQTDTITLKTPQQPNYRLFAVASGKVQGRISEKKYWKDTDSGQMYVILSVISISHGTEVPSVLQYFALGRLYSHEEIWQRRCKNSEFLFFLICEPIEEEQ